MRILPALGPALAVLTLAACSSSPNVTAVGATTTGMGGATVSTGVGTGGTTVTGSTGSGGTGGMPGPSDLPWSKSFGGAMLTGRALVGGLTSDDSVLGATWVGSDLNGGLPSPFHLRRFDPAGSPVQDEGAGSLRDLVPNPDGSLVVAFDLESSAPATILGQTVSCSTLCASVTHIGADGTPLWIRTFESSGDLAGVNIDTLRVAADGHIAVSGWFTNTVDFGAGPLVADPNTVTLFVAELTPDGSTAWSRAVRFPGGGYWYGLTMAVSPAGDVLIAGMNEGLVDYGAGVMPVSGMPGTIGFFARYDATGAVDSSAVFPMHSYVFPVVAFDAAGDALVSTWLDGAFDLGGGTVGTVGETQLQLITLDPSGNLLRATPLAQAPTVSGPYTLAINDLSVDGQGNAWLCGDVSGPFTVAGTMMQPVSASDVLLLEIDATGNLVKERQYGTTGKLRCSGIRLGPTGVPAIFGTMTGSVDFGQGPLQAAGTVDGFIAKLGPGGP